MVRLIRSWLNIRVILGAIFFAVCVFGILLAVLWSSKVKAITPISATAILSVIQAPTETPPAPLTTVTPTLEPTTSPGEPLPHGEIVLGDYVQVVGTEGDGLRLHTSAGVSTDVRYVATESQVFLVKEGPVDTDGYIWWLLQDPYTENAWGWGVSNYLSVVQNP